MSSPALSVVEGGRMTDEKFAALKADRPSRELVWLRAAGEEGVFSSPPAEEWKRFKVLFSDPAKRPDSFEALVFGCLVYPTRDEFRIAMNRKPALCEVFGQHLAAAAGMGAEVEEKKL